jgi:2,3-bisphosphoglycerate-independent phosphoglycerate mutase
VVRAIEEDGYGFVIVNFANPDMVGHTGEIPAVVQAVETTDACLGRLVDAVERAGGVTLVIADHGNAETLLQEDGSPHTAHTTNPVPVILTAPGARLRDGELSDVAPTVLALLGTDVSIEMSGQNLVQIR